MFFIVSTGTDTVLKLPIRFLRFRVLRFLKYDWRVARHDLQLRCCVLIELIVLLAQLILIRFLLHLCFSNCLRFNCTYYISCTIVSYKRFWWRRRANTEKSSVGKENSIVNVSLDLHRETFSSQDGRARGS
jgi:hypothetical protein